MSLSDLASVGSFVSGFAVLVSLIFLYFQLRQLNRQVTQTERNQQAQIRQGRADRTVGLLLTRLEPSVALAVRKGISGAEEITALELEQFGVWQRAAFFNWQETFDQRRAGLIDNSEFEDLTQNIRGLLAYPGVRAQWKLQRRNPLSRDFTAWMDSLTAEQLIIAPADRVAEWKAEVAALKARPAE